MRDIGACTVGLVGYGNITKDKAALVDALRGGRLAAAGLDVFDVEPVLPSNPLLENPANCHRLLDGKQLAHVISQPTGLD